MYEGEVFTYRSSPAHRQAPPQARAGRPAPQPAPEVGAQVERLAHLEASLLRLEETVAQLAATAARLNGALEELQSASVKHVAAAVPEPGTITATVDASAIKSTVTMMKADPPPAPVAQPEVKVSMYGGGATEALVGQVRITSSD